jgi:hypothetical protein
MSTSDAIALKNSGLNEFLFADVGIEANGSPLTILSMLARLGQDPWAEAGRWTNLPKASAIDCLAASISRMPLSPQSLAEARTTATQLVPLLPVQTQPLRPGASVAEGKSIAPPWFPIAIFIAALAFGIGFGMIPQVTPPDASKPLASHIMEHSEAPIN